MFDPFVIKSEYAYNTGTKQQAIIIIGHDVPMPVVVKIRNYDEDFYATIICEGSMTAAATKDKLGSSVGEKRQL